MDALRDFLNARPPSRQKAFAKRCGTSLGYLRKAISVGARLSEALVISIERESGGEVRCESLRPDVDWEYLRRRSLASDKSMTRAVS